MPGVRSKSRPWRSLNEAGTSGLGLPKPRAQGLALQHGWRIVAGERLAESVRADGVRQGVLELITDTKPWRDAVLPALPALAARLASMHPELRIRKVRLRLAEEAGLAPALAVPVLPPASREAPPKPAGPAPPERPDEPVEVRLTRLARGYLACAANRKEKPQKP
jgi:hypothetical protein